jgi:hypothetical protein
VIFLANSAARRSCASSIWEHGVAQKNDEPRGDREFCRGPIMSSDTGEFSYFEAILPPRVNEASSLRLTKRRRVTPKLSIGSDRAGFDPYNSTGSFDRVNAWSKLRRR